MSSKLSHGAAPFVPKSSTPSSSVGLKPNLSASAAPFTPVSKKVAAVAAAAAASASAPAPVPVVPTAPTPLTAKPFNAAEVAAGSGLSASATPYSPTRTSPTAKGTPAFPSAPVAQAAALASAAPAPAPAPAPVDVPSSATENASNFAASKLVVKNPKQAPVHSMDVPKFSHSWGLICNNHLDPKNYTGVEIRRVGDIEQFWRLWHHVPLFSSKVSTSAGSAYTYHWFKGTIKPSWEDTANANGGILTIPMLTMDRVSYLDAKGKTIIDDIYMTILMFATGAAKPCSSHINGITIKSRNGVAIDLWLDTTDSEKIKGLVEAVREAIAPLDNKYEKEKFAYMSNAQRVAAPAPTSSGYKNKAAKVEKKIDYY